MIQIVNVNESERWDSIVKSFKSYDVFYLNTYVKAFNDNGDGEPVLFYYNDEDTKAINVFMQRDISNLEVFKEKLQEDKWFDITSPYGYGGFWVEGANYNAVNEAYNSFCKERGYICEFVRFNLFSNYCKAYDGEVECRTHNVIRSLDLNLEDMLMDFEHKVRKNLKKANKAGLKVIVDNSGELINEFLNIYYSTMDRNAADNQFFFSREFFEKINRMKGNFVYIHVAYENKVISTELVLYDDTTCYSFLGGTNSEYFHLRPNDFLKFEIIKWAKTQGLKNFVLGGGYGKDDGIFRYKKSLAPNGVCDFFIGKKIFDKEKYDKLVEIRNETDKGIEDTLFFPLYRGI